MQESCETDSSELGRHHDADRPVDCPDRGDPQVCCRPEL